MVKFQRQLLSLEIDERNLKLVDDQRSLRADACHFQQLASSLPSSKSVAFII
jgi:hypothetical protein